MDLSGTWRAAAADEGLRRRYFQPGFDDTTWAELDVPGHWRSNPAFADHDGPVLYRRSFAGGAPGSADRRGWLVLDGIFYQGDVWLDGVYLGVTEGYFFPHAFEVTAGLRDRSEHVLAVEVACDRQTDRTAKRNLTGVFQHWDCLDPDWNPGGIWRPVRLEETGAVRVSRLRVLCAEASADSAVLHCTAVLDAAEAGTVQLRTTVGGAAEHSQDSPLATGDNTVSWQVTVDRPDLWWPHALGEQPMYDVAVEVTVQGELSHRVTRRTGLRQVRMRNWIATVNGERLFLKGSNQGPTRMELAEATAEDFERDTLLAKEAGLDLLRVHAHVSKPELYEAADRHGLLLWQDMPLQWGYSRTVRKQAARQARELVDLLGHHPSIAVWCGHNAPAGEVRRGGGVGVPAAPAKRRSGAEPASRAARAIAGQELPTWNKTVLDRTIKRSLERSDSTRPVVAHSGVWPHVGSGGTDTHVYFGWYHCNERDFPRFCAAVPRQARFVTEFGAQAIPESAGFMEPERWPALDWETLGRTRSLQKHQFDKHVPPSAFPTFEAWRAATQAYQADVVRFHIETLRRLKYRPSGGFAQFAYADSYPAVTWSVLDHLRVPKAGYQALAAACAPVIVVADRPAASYAPGAPIALDVHVVSDLRTPVNGGQVTARLRWPGGEHRWTWAGEVPADSCVRVGTVQAVAPDAPGPLSLELAFESADVKVVNAYASSITPPRR
jgi:beta-mannosidase